MNSYTIPTGHAQHGTEITYDRGGAVVNKVACAHARGTTVRLEKLFADWPVRHREMKRNIKKEYGKMVQLMQAYCLVRPDVRFSCTNISDKGARSTVLTTPGKRDLRSAITVLFGHKQLQALDAYVPAPEPKPGAAADDADASGATAAAAATSDNSSVAQSITIVGFVSKAKPECGRGSGDRQFLSINNRPCDIPKVTKTINEVYVTPLSAY